MTSPRFDIAYIGVGLMGGPMAARLLECGHSVRAFDVDPARLDAICLHGARRAGSAKEATEGANVVVLNLPTPNAVESAVFGPDGVAGAMHAPQTLIDFSTIEVDRCRALAERLTARTGCHWVDAPVSGGPPAAAEGTLAVMAGGPIESIERLQPIFADISSSFTRVGDTGAGLTAKMVSQLIVSALYVLLAEGAKLAKAAGVDVSLIPSCVAGGHADGVLMRQIFPRFAELDFAPRAYTRQLIKDMYMVKELADISGAPTPMLNEALRLFETYSALGGGERDASAIFELYEQNAGSQRVPAKASS